MTIFGELIKFGELIEFGQLIKIGESESKIEIFRDFEIVENEESPLLFGNDEKTWIESWINGDFSIPNGHFLYQKENRVKFIPRNL